MDKEIKKEFNKIWKKLAELEEKAAKPIKKKGSQSESPFNMKLPKLPGAFGRG